jgi:hypothetical protein
MKLQHPLTLITPVKADCKDQLLADLDRLQDTLYKMEDEIVTSRGNNPMEGIDTIHYARWLVIDTDIEKGVSSMGDMPKLVFSSNFDGDPEEHLMTVCEKVGDLIDDVYDNCEGYPTYKPVKPEERYKYLSQWKVKPSAFYEGSPGRTVKQIYEEDKLRGAIRSFLDGKNWDGQSARQVHQAIKDNVLSQESFAWAKEPYSMPRNKLLELIAAAIILSPVLIILAILVAFWILYIHFFHERSDVNFTLRRSQLDDKKMQYLERMEDREMQNQFSQLVLMKPGPARLFTYNLMMFVARALIKYLFVEGKLMGIPTIHFARWVLFDNNKRVIFFSNFDGSWQQYLGDFIDKSGWGLTGIFSNTQVFPKTRFLVTGGAYDEEHFLAWSRNSEVPTRLWYCAYPHLSIKNVNNNSRIRSLLPRELSEKDAVAFLKLI